MKGISEVIAVLLMLVIVIGLTGLAYTYITGVFTARTAVVLSVDAAATTCAPNNGPITVFVRNDGTTASGIVTVSVTPPSGATPTCASIASIAAGGINSTTCTGRTGGAGYYSIRASTTGSTASGSVYCAS